MVDSKPHKTKDLEKKGRSILNGARDTGWVLEPDAKALMELYGLDIPRFYLGDSLKGAKLFLKQADGPVAAKCVSPDILHKTEHGAVVTNIRTGAQLEAAVKKFRRLPGYRQVLVETMIQGVELLVGAKIDYQFGPVVVMGIGGINVEIYQDTAIRMAPLVPADIRSMVDALKGKKILQGYRGRPGVDMDAVIEMGVRFSSLVCGMKEMIESIDLNPVICTPDSCVIADARIVLNRDYIEHKDTGPDSL